MKVILTEKVKALGNVGDIVNVSAGYARNFIIPNNLGMIADDSNMKQIADYKKMLSKKVAAEKAEAEALAAKVKGTTLTFIKKVGGNGSLFGTITTSEIAKEFDKQGIHLERRLIVIENPIKNLGTFEVSAKIFAGVEAKFKVKVELDPEQAEEIKKKSKAAKKEKVVEAQAEGEAATEATAE
jgi:large subunit ribosomal protein L9